MALKRFFDYYFALGVSILITAFLFQSIPSYLRLVDAWENNHVLDVTFYAAQIGFYLTLVVVAISFISLMASSRSRTGSMLFKLHQEVKILRKQSEIHMTSINNPYNDNALQDTLKLMDSHLLQIIEKSNPSRIISKQTKMTSKKKITKKK
jgi:hypothetical protein